MIWYRASDLYQRHVLGRPRADHPLLLDEVLQAIRAVFGVAGVCRPHRRGLCQPVHARIDAHDPRRNCARRSSPPSRGRARRLPAGGGRWSIAWRSAARRRSHRGLPRRPAGPIVAPARVTDLGGGRSRSTATTITAWRPPACWRPTRRGGGAELLDQRRSATGPGTRRWDEVAVALEALGRRHAGRAAPGTAAGLLDLGFAIPAGGRPHRPCDRRALIYSRGGHRRGRCASSADLARRPPADGGGDTAGGVRVRAGMGRTAPTPEVVVGKYERRGRGGEEAGRPGADGDAAQLRAPPAARAGGGRGGGSPTDRSRSFGRSPASPGRRRASVRRRACVTPRHGRGGAEPALAHGNGVRSEPPARDRAARSVPGERVGGRGACCSPEGRGGASG